MVFPVHTRLIKDELVSIYFPQFLNHCHDNNILVVVVNHQLWHVNFRYILAKPSSASRRHYHVLDLQNNIISMFCHKWQIRWMNACLPAASSYLVFITEIMLFYYSSSCCCCCLLLFLWYYIITLNLYCAHNNSSNNKTNKFHL